MSAHVRFWCTDNKNGYSSFCAKLSFHLKQSMNDEQQKWRGHMPGLLSMASSLCFGLDVSVVATFIIIIFSDVDVHGLHRRANVC